MKSMVDGAESVRQRKVSLDSFPNRYINEALKYMVDDLTGPVIAVPPAVAPPVQVAPAADNPFQKLIDALEEVK